MFPGRHGTYKEIILATAEKCLKNIHKDFLTLIPHTEIINDRDCNNQSEEGK